VVDDADMIKVADHIVDLELGAGSRADAWCIPARSTG
jgi:hypothetical protein